MTFTQHCMYTCWVHMLIRPIPSADLGVVASLGLVSNVVAASVILISWQRRRLASVFNILVAYLLILHTSYIATNLLIVSNQSLYVLYLQLPGRVCRYCECSIRPTLWTCSSPTFCTRWSRSFCTRPRSSPVWWLENAIRLSGILWNIGMNDCFPLSFSVCFSSSLRGQSPTVKVKETNSLECCTKIWPTWAIAMYPFASASQPMPLVSSWLTKNRTRIRNLRSGL